MILSLDASAVTASAALTEGKQVLRSEFVHAGLTHSETLLPMVQRVMNGYRIADLEAIAVTAGPGSFTGVRIGVATVKGLAFAADLPCIAVSTLAAIAHNFTEDTCIVCAVMDARRLQFYNALFSCRNGEVRRLCADRAISLEALRSELAGYAHVVLAGDGAALCYENIALPNVTLAAEDKRYQNGVGVALAAEQEERIPSAQLMPVYLRPSQAERELKKRS